MNDDWHQDARCHGDGYLFFGPSGYESKPRRLRREASAKRVCAGCAVRAECLEYALAARETAGVWGGLSPRERLVELSRRGRSAEAYSVGRALGLHHGTVTNLMSLVDR